MKEMKTVEQRYAPIKEYAGYLFEDIQFVEWEYGGGDIVDDFISTVDILYNQKPQTHSEVDWYLILLEEAKAIMAEVRNRWN